MNSINLMESIISAIITPPNQCCQVCESKPVQLLLKTSPFAFFSAVGCPLRQNRITWGDRFILQTTHSNRIKVSQFHAKTWTWQHSPSVCHWTNKQIVPPPNSRYWLSHCCWSRWNNQCLKSTTKPYLLLSLHIIMDFNFTVYQNITFLMKMCNHEINK